MKRSLFRIISLTGATVAFLLAFYGLAIVNTPKTDAVKATDFKAGRIIDDEIFYNPSTMTVADIQAVLDRYMPNCDTWGTGQLGSGYYVNGVAVPATTKRVDYARMMREAGDARYHDAPYICINNYYENPTTHETLFETNNVIKEGMISAAQIIYDAANEFNINPQVLIVLLKKESYVWGDNWPTKNEYNTPMGYACPDHAACDTKYYGFYNQVEMAAWQLNYYREHVYSYNYRPYANNKIYYSPDYSCGTKTVYLENIATTSLYIYTPYTPNDAALKNYPGTATCGSYGNRNFFMYFNEMFGTTYFASNRANIENDTYYMVPAAKTNQALFFNEEITLQTRDKSQQSQFKLVKNTDNTYTLQNAANNKYLSINEDEDALIQTEAGSDLAQKWHIYESNDGAYIVSSAKNSALTITFADDGIKLDSYNTSNNNQKLHFVIATPLVEDGSYYIKNAAVQNLVVGVSGTNIQLAEKTDNETNKFIVHIDELTNSYYFTNVGQDKNIDAAGTGATQGANVQIYAKSTDCTQRWKILKNDDDSYRIQSACSENVFDVFGGSLRAGTNIRMYTSNQTNSQKWLFEKIAAEQIDESQPEPEQSTTPTVERLADGTYIIQNKKTGKAVDVSGNRVDDRTNVQIYPIDGTTAQVFKVTYSETNKNYTITGIRSNKVLDVNGGSAAAGANVQIYTANGTKAQQWEITKDSDGSYVIINAISGKYLGIDGTNINVQNPTNGDDQRWIFKDNASQQTPETTTPTEETLSGTYTLRSSVNANYYMAAYGGGSKNGQNIQLATKANTNAQKFNFRYNSDGYYTITTSGYGLAIDVSGASKADTANIRVWVSNDTCAQRWKAVKNSDGSYTFFNKCSNKVIDIKGGLAINERNIQQFTSNGTKAQKWFLTKV